MCGKGEPEVEFAIKKDGNRYYRRFLCRGCEVEYRKKFPRTKRTRDSNSNRSIREALRRADKGNRATYIVRDSKKDDRNKGLENDLDREFVEMLTMRPCSYCGDTGSMVTLDRIDNTKGHTKSNVIQACYRCNIFRRDMPYKAWMLLVPSLKKARKMGLLDGWTCGMQKKVNGSVAQMEEPNTLIFRMGLRAAPLPPVVP